jgi:filamentous hemagglutinin family protein
MSSTSRSLTATRRLPAARLRPLLAAMLMAGAIGPVAAVTTGTASDTTTPTGMTLKQGASELTVTTNAAGIVTMRADQTSSRAVWEASDFSVGAKAAFVNNATLGANTDTLIRVVGFTPSVILGPVSANNRLWLVNSNGLYVGSTGSITASSVMMSARDVNAAEVESGYATFMSAGQKAKLLVDASSNDFSGGYIEIEARTDGQPSILATGSTADGTAGGVVLMGSSYVYNKGVVQANGGGAIGMVVANDVTVQVGDSGFIELAPLSSTATTNSSGLGRAVANEGTVQANDGHIELIVAGSGNDGVILGSDTAVRGTQSNLSGAGLSVSGVINLGKVIANVTRTGGSSSVLMQAVGGNGNSVVGNLGTVDVSALEGVSAKGGDIDLVGPNVGNEGATSAAQLLADGDTGGGRINLIVQDANGNITQSGRVITGNLSLISADARLNGQGGTVRLLGASNVPSFADTKTSTGVYTGEVNTSVTLLGTVQARGGTVSGDGGQIVASGTALALRQTNAQTGAVTKASLNVGARSDTGKAGWVKLYSPYVTIATASALLSTTSGAALVDEDLSRFLTDGANIEVGAFRTGSFYTASIYVEPGAQLVSGSKTAQSLRLVSDDDLTVGNGFSTDVIDIRATSAPMSVTLVADANNDGRGNLEVQGTNTDIVASAVPGQAFAQGVNGSSTLNIVTQGGDITLVGRSNAAQDSSFGDAVYVSDAFFDAGGGKISASGVGGNVSGEGSAYNGGVSIFDSTFTGGDIDITGGSLAGSGVSLFGVSLATTTNGQITIHGYAQDAASPNQHIGVEAQQVDVSLGSSGQFKMTGYASGGSKNDAIGVSVGAMSFITSRDTSATKVPRITVVGQSGQSTLPGLQVTRGISLIDTSDAPSNADVVLGAKADAQAITAMTLGSSYFNTTGHINVRPLQVAATTGALTDDLSTPIYIGPAAGAAGVGTNFAVDPNLFSGQMGSGMDVVVGSSLHTGHITVADDVFNGAVITTLQNQGTGASGITVGKQSGNALYQVAAASSFATAQATAEGASAGVLNLLSAGNINQTGPIVAQSMVVVAGPGATVNLSDSGNVIGSLVVSGGSQVNVTQGATPASTGTASAYDASAQQFVTITANINGDSPVVRPTGPTESEIAAAPSRTTVESTEALADLRTDVYVRGQFTRPQVCTPANTGGSVVIDVDADPLAQNWLQVRRSAQLSSCSGVRNDSNCSAF